MRIEVTEDDIKKITGIAVTVYKQYYVHGITVEDLAGEGKLAFMKAMQNYNPEKNTYFWGFAYKKVKGAMIDLIRKQFPKAANECNFIVGDEEYTDYATFQIEDTSIDSDIDYEKLKVLFMKAISGVTKLEQGILYDYYITGLPVYKVAKKYSTKHFKIKHIISEVSTYIKEVLDGKIKVDEIDLRISQVN